MRDGLVTPWTGPAAGQRVPPREGSRLLQQPPQVVQSPAPATVTQAITPNNPHHLFLPIAKFFACCLNLTVAPVFYEVG